MAENLTEQPLPVIFENITRIKAPDEMLAEAKSQGLEKLLGLLI